MFHVLGSTTERTTLQSSSDYFGDLSKNAPCCSSITYAVLNTVAAPWTDATLQQTVCISRHQRRVCLIESYLLGLMANIKCSICSCQCKYWFYNLCLIESNWIYLRLYWDQYVRLSFFLMADKKNSMRSLT